MANRREPIPAVAPGSSAVPGSRCSPGSRHGAQPCVRSRGVCPANRLQPAYTNAVSLIQEHRLAQQVRDIRAILLDIVELGNVDALEALAHGLDRDGRVDTVLQCDHLTAMATDQV